MFHAVFSFLRFDIATETSEEGEKDRLVQQLPVWGMGATGTPYGVRWPQFFLMWEPGDAGTVCRPDVSLSHLQTGH